MLVIPGFFESYRSLKDRTLKLVFGTSELSPEQVTAIHTALNKSGYMAFHTDMFTDAQLKGIAEIQVDYEDTAKTPGQRLRAVLYRNWEKENQGYENFHDFYIVNMDKLINHFKGKLD